MLRLCPQGKDCIATTTAIVHCIRPVVTMSKVDMNVKSRDREFKSQVFIAIWNRSLNVLGNCPNRIWFLERAIDHFQDHKGKVRESGQSVN